MTFVTLINRFCPLSKAHITYPSPGKLSSNIKCKIYACFTQVYFQFWKVHIIKSYKISYTSYFISCCITSVFTSADVIFNNFSGLDSKLSKIKKDTFVTNYLVLTDSPKTLEPLNNKNLLGVTEVSCYCSFNLLLYILSLISLAKRLGSISKTNLLCSKRILAVS